MEGFWHHQLPGNKKKKNKKKKKNIKKGLPLEKKSLKENVLWD